MSRILHIFLSVFIFISTNAQTEIDALRFSRYDISGTARFTSMSGAYGALGADFTSLSYNPAGLGLYQSNELTLTPQFGNITAKSFFNNSKNINDKLFSNFSNFGYVASSLKDSKEEWRRINLAVGYNSTANYKKRVFLSGFNNTSSMIDNFLLNSQGKIIANLNNFNELLAWNTYLFDPMDSIDNGNYISNLNSKLNKYQEKTINSSGSSGEYVFSFGTSYEEVVYIGATIGMPIIDYYEESIYSESQFSDTAFHLSSFNLIEEISTSGRGLNLKVGLIARMNDWIKIGGAIHSPTYYDIEEQYNTSITAEWENSLGTMYDSSPFDYFNYELKTPWKTIGSISANIENKGLLSIDIEIVDYSTAIYSSDTYQYTEENEIINSLYTKSTNIRMGGEVKYKPFRIRAGYAHYSSPYKENPELLNKSFSFGLGLDRGFFTADLTFILSEENNEHLVYSSDIIKPATITTIKHNILLTLGLRY